MKSFEEERQETVIKNRERRLRQGNSGASHRMDPITPRFTIPPGEGRKRTEG